MSEVTAWHRRRPSEPTRDVSVLVACGRTLARSGFCALIDCAPDLVCAGEASTGEDVVSFVEAHQPDLVFIDLMIPGLSATSVMRQLSASGSPTRVVAIVFYADPTYLAEAERAGAAGFVTLDTPPEDFYALLREVAGVAPDPFLPGADAPGVSPETYDGGQLSDVLADLTDRERQTFALAVEGFSNLEVAARLFISPRTAEKHRARALRKLGLRTQADLVRFAAFHGLLEVPFGPVAER